MKQPNYYAVLPAAVRYDTELSSTAKLLYAEISALSNNEGYCWGSNKYLADTMGVEKKHLSVMVQALKKKGYIKTEIVNSARRIYLTDYPGKYGGVSLKKSTTLLKKDDPYIVNTISNTITNRADLRSVVYTYYKLKETFNDAYMKDQYGRYIKTAKKILNYTGGKLDIATEMLHRAKRYFDVKGLNWTLETVAKCWGEIEKFREVRYE